MRIFQSFRKTTTASMLGVAIFAVLLVGGIWLGQEYVKFDAVSHSVKEQHLQQQRELIKTEVDRVVQYIQYKRAQTEKQLRSNLKARVQEAVTVAENIYNANAGKIDDTRITQLIVDALRPIRFNEGRGYYFIYQHDGTNVMLPFSPELEGTNLLHLQDSKGNYTIQRAQKIIDEIGSGFLDWYWFKPEDQSQMRKKIGFVQRFHPLGWWIGTGEYFEDFEEIIQQQTLDWINNISYGKDGYIYVSDYDGFSLAHYNEHYRGINRWELRDVNNVAIYQELITLAKNDDGGYLNYVGTLRPSTGMPGSKLAYARGIQDWQWMVGTGVYIDSINEQLDSMRQELLHKIQRNFLIICLILAVCVYLVILLSRFLAGRLSNDLVLFTHFFKDAAQTGRKIQTSDVYFTELRGLAESANNMVDERNLAETELTKVQEQLLQSRKMEALGLLAGGVAHDLNNVLSAIVGYPDLLLNSFPEGSQQRKFVKTIKNSGQKAADIVDDLLALTRRGVAQKIILDINSLVEQYLQSPEYTRTFESHPGIVVETDLDPTLLKIKGSHIHIQKIIMNLTNNGAEAQPGSGHIQISTENRYLDQPLMGYQKIEQGEYAVLTVTDQGTGIATEDLGRIFEPFFSRKNLGRSGTGLGMAVVWGTVQDHEGFVNIITGKDEGTSIELYFPATRETIANEVQLPDRLEYLGDGEHILVVDDIAEQRELVRAILQGLGYTTTELSSGHDAVAYLKENRVDLVILDMILEDPDMDGLETYKRIVQLYPEQKTIIASGYAETDRVKAALSLGVTQYVKKPYTVEQIGITIRDILKR